MSDYIKISKDKIVAYTWNGDRKSEHIIKKENGRVVVRPKRSEKVVFAGKTVEEAEQFFYDTEEPDMLWQHLRSRCLIDPDVTLADLFNHIKKDEMTKFLVDHIWPTYAETPQPTPSLIRRKVVINGLSLYVNRDVEGCSGFKFPSVPMLLVLEEKGTIIHNDKVISAFNSTWTLLEIFAMLFDNASNHTVINLTKNGLMSIMDEEVMPITSEPCIFSHLLNPCRLGPDVTLGDIFDFVKSNELLKQFIAQYSWCKGIDDFHTDAETPVASEGEEISHLMVKKYVKNMNGVLDLFIEFEGVGKLSEATHNAIIDATPLGQRPALPETERYGIGFSPMGELAGLRVIADSQVEIQVDDKTIINCVTDFSLLDILDAIYWEISFYGNPADVKKVKTKLLEEVQKIESGEVETRPFPPLEE